MRKQLVPMENFTMAHYHRFFNPRSVVVVGASDKKGPGSYNLMENLIKEGCTARLYPVNIRSAEVLGHRAYRSVLDIPEIADLAVITVPRKAVLGSLGECVQKGIKSVVIVTQGFADADEEGQRMQEEMQAMIRGTGTRIIGPNSIGVANAFDYFHTSFQRFDLVKKENAMICQSGLFVLASADFTQGLGLGVDIGNGADLGFAEFLSCMGHDPRIKVINLHMEGISQGQAFLDAAARVTPKKPVLVYKVGRSEEGRKAAASHSASLAGEDHVFDAAFQKAGVIRVQNIEALSDMNKAFLTYPMIKGKRFAVITLTGGGGIAVIDALRKHGLDLASPCQGVMDAIQGMNPPWLKVSNPVDTWMASLKKGLARASVDILHLLLEDDQVDGAILLLNAYRATGFTVLGEMLEGIVDEARRNREKPVALWVFGANQDAVIERAEKSGVVAGFTSPERLARAMAGLYHYHRNIKNRTPQKPSRVSALSPEQTSKMIQRFMEAGSNPLCTEVFEILKSYGIPVARTHFAPNKEAALSMAEDLGYPLVMKIVSSQIIHKSDVGGIMLNIRGQEEADNGFDALMSSVRSKVPHAQVKGVSLQRHYTGCIELLIGSKRDVEFGPLILFGLGGIYTEILQDLAIRLAPLTEEEAREMIAGMKWKEILLGARGGPVANMDALVDILVRVSALVMDFPQIKELDINPLIARREHVLALDARVFLGD